MRRKFHDMTPAKLSEALMEARALAGSSDAARQRVGELGSEAARRLLAQETAVRSARKAWIAGVGTRAFAVLWWLHAAVCGLLLLAAMEEAGRRGGEPVLPLIIAIALAAALIVVRWVLSGRWRFGPHV
jgi:hypothetical protein